MTEPNASARATSTRTAGSGARPPTAPAAAQARLRGSWRAPRRESPSATRTPSATEIAATHPPRLPVRILTALAALVLLAAGAALAQSGSGEGGSGTEDPGGRVPSFEIVERTATDRVGTTLRVQVEVDGRATPTVVVVGPDGTLLRESGASVTFADLPQGDYLVAATAPLQRVASGTLNAVDGDEVDLTLRLFNQRRSYADESDTPILGIFTMDVADNDDEEEGAIELNASPTGRMAIVGADGYVATFPTVAEQRIFEGLEPGTYVVAVTAESLPLAMARVVIGVGERATVSAELQ